MKAPFKEDSLHRVSLFFARRLLKAAKTFASKIFKTHEFGYRRITIERPLRLSYQFSDERITWLAQKQILLIQRNTSWSRLTRWVRRRPRIRKSNSCRRSCIA